MAEIPVAEKKEVRIGDWLGEAWNLTVENIGPHLLLGLVLGLVSIVSSFTLVGPILISGAIWCGAFFYAKKRMLKQPAEIGDVFKGFDVFVESLK